MQLNCGATTIVSFRLYSHIKDSQESVKSLAIKMLHLHRTRNICRYTPRQYRITPNPLLMKPPRHILRCTNLHIFN
jgi:hypothetical protein